MAKRTWLVLGAESVMGRAFALAVQAGRMAHLAKLAEESAVARASSPLTGFLQ